MGVPGKVPVMPIMFRLFPDGAVGPAAGPFRQDTLKKVHSDRAIIIVGFTKRSATRLLITENKIDTWIAEIK